jgi:hypothetical protein
VRLRREWLEVLVLVWCPRSGGHKRADLFQMCGLGMSFEKGASSRLEGLEPCPSLLEVASTLLSYWQTRYEIDLSCPGR